MHPFHSVIGVDLGKLRDYAALTHIERWSDYSHRDPVRFTGIYHWANTVRMCERLQLGTSYPRVVARIAAIVNQLSPHGPVTLVVDATGVGQPVVDYIRKENLRCEFQPITITAGEKATRTAVPKRELLVNLQLLFARKELQIPAQLPTRKALIDELASMDQTLKAQGSRHDDMALSLALAAWPLRPRPTIGEQPNRLL
jgi:hypothetical protein